MTRPRFTRPRFTRPAIRPADAGRRLGARYGGSPAHLLASLAALAIAAAAVLGWLQRPRDLEGVLIWFGIAAVLHDLVLLPLYSLVDRISIGQLPRHLGAYVRVPALISGLLFVVLFPTILGYGAATFHGASGLTEHGYLARWLLLSGVLFALSGLAFAARRRR
jgi:hypothetical protein